MRAQLVLAVAIALSGCAGKQEQVLTPVPVRQGAFVVEVETEGVVQPLDSHAIAAPSNVWGSVEWLAPEGRTVKKGDVLARISVRDMEENLFERQDELAREERRLKRLQADAPVKRFEIEQEILDKERQWRIAELAHQQAARGGRRDQREAAKRDVAVASLKLATGALDKKRELYDKGVIAKSELDQAELDHRVATLNRKRAELALALLAPGANREEVDKARYSADKAKAAYEGVQIEAPAKSSLLELDQDKSKTRSRRLANRVRNLEERVRSATITAPADGMLIYPLIWGWQKAHVGMDVWEGLNFLEVARLDRVKVLGSVSEQEIAKVRDGAAVTITADGLPGRSFPGKVHRVSQLAKEEEGEAGTFGVKRFDVEVRPDAPTPELRPNMRVSVAIRYQSLASASAVPQEALFGGKEAPHIWLSTPQGPRKQAVKPVLFGPDWVALETPLASGAAVYLLDPETFGTAPAESAAASGEATP